MRRASVIVCVIAAVVWAGAESSSPGGARDPDDALDVQDTSQFRTGDLLFVRGTSWQSRIVLFLDGYIEDYGSHFSHVGMVWRRNGRAYVIHASPKSLLGVQDDGSVRLEPLRQFLSAAHISRAALYRVGVEDPRTAERAATMAREYVNRALPYDRVFDASTPGALYCTELVWRAYRAAGLRVPATFSARAHYPLLPSALSRSPLVTQIDRFP
ncbi:MAG: YiiX/YebB-like N1pC/P60 family cysteine hydrolase [Salinibacter sp.]|uniref:YiiX/YebB-like N1pC/P60 family cysteine hydrolase n=1 Tax=Salinibacter sp. TaxID=2065818 RepID=UPI002FC3339E